MVLIIFFLLFSSVKLSDAMPQEVRIGGFLDLESYQGKQCNVAIQLAIQDVNDYRTLLNATRLEFLNGQLGSSALTNAANVMELLSANVVSVVAPMTAYVSNFISLVTDSSQLPLLTFAVNDVSVRMKHSAYSIQMFGSDAVQMKAIASLLQKFYWREIVVIFQDDEVGVGGILALNNALRTLTGGSRIVQKFPVSDEYFNGSSWKAILKSLDKEKTRSRVFLVHTSYHLAKKIFREAKHSGVMQQQGYVWIVTEWVANYLDVVHDKGMDSMQGIIGVRRHIPSSSRLQHINTRWNESFTRAYPDVLHSDNISMIGAYAYDSIWVIARAIDDLFRVNNRTELEFGSATDAPFFQEGSVMFKMAADTSFEGISGQTAFSENGLLEVDSYDIINVVNKEIRVVGSWTKEGLNLIREEGLEITWPNGSSIPHSGYRKFLVGVPPHVVFAEFVNITDNNRNFSGFCIDVFRHALEKLPYHLDYEFQVSEESDKNPDYDDLVDQVANKTFDVVVADITILTNRTAKVDFTQPYTDTGLVIMVPMKKTRSSGWPFLQPFTRSMWLTAADCAYCYSSLAIGKEREPCFHRKSCQANGSVPLVSIRNWECSCRYSFSTIVFAHREKVMTCLGKLILMIWLFVVLILNSSYTDSLASILTAQQLSPIIQDTETLRANNVRIGHLFGSFVETYLTNELKIDQTRLRSLVKPEDYVELLRNGSIGAIVDEIPYINMVMSKHCGELTIVGQPFYRGGFGILFAKGSPVVSEMTSAVLNLTQNKTELEEIRRKWFASHFPSSSSSPCVDKEENYGSGQLSLGTFWRLFVIATAAYCSMVLAYFGLKFHKFRQSGTRVQDVQPIPPEIPLVAIDPGPLNPNIYTLSPPFPQIFTSQLIPTSQCGVYIVNPRRRRALSA